MVKSQYQLGVSQLVIAVLFVLVASAGTLPVVRFATLLCGAALIAAVPFSIWTGNGPMDREHVWMTPPGDVPWAALQFGWHAALLAVTLLAAGFEWWRLTAAATATATATIKPLPNAIAVEAATRARSRSPARNAKQD